MSRPRFLLGAISSNAGKTTITCAILQALKRRGLSVASFKCGPDYLDPMFHAQAIGTSAWNLDEFFTKPDILNALFREHSAHCDLSVMEGVMGYFDGLGGISSAASACAIARATQTPAVLIVPCQGISFSLLAMIQGFFSYDCPNQLSGVILNQISPMLYPALSKQIQEQLGVRVYGYFPSRPDLTLPSRRLGLVPVGELEQVVEILDQLALQAEKTLDLDGLIALANRAPRHVSPPIPLPKCAAGPRPKIAVARDAAFCFLYPDNLELLEKFGAEPCFFSPLHDDRLPDCHGLLLPGGYPERHVQALSQNHAMRADILRALRDGLPCVAEGGGFLYLHRNLTDAQGNTAAMVGAIEADAFPTDRLQRFGYATLTARRDSMLGAAGTSFPVHEFHYWESTDPGDGFSAAKPTGTRSWNCVHTSPTLYAGFPQLYWYGNPEVATRFVNACQTYAFHKKSTEYRK